MQVCQVCQKSNPAGVEFCEDCGAALTPQQAPVPAGAAVGATSAPAPGTPPVPPADMSPPPGPLPSAPAAPLPTGDPPMPAPASADAAPAGPVDAPSVPSTEPPAAGGNARLVVKRYGSTTGEEIPLLGDRLMVGRFDPETGPVDIDLSQAAEAAHISRQHGELYREADGRWHVRDLGSTNGVFVKGGGDASFGPRITAPRALADGDEVAFGNARFLFRAD